jgi:hypothetical protein
MFLELALYTLIKNIPGWIWGKQPVFRLMCS